MGKFGGEVFIIAVLSPHIERASSQLANLFNKKKEMEPEDKLAIYVKLRALKRKVDVTGGLNERTAFSRNVDSDSSDHGDRWNSRSAIDEFGERNEREHKK